MHSGLVDVATTDNSVPTQIIFFFLVTFVDRAMRLHKFNAPNGVQHAARDRMTMSAAKYLLHCSCYNR